MAIELDKRKYSSKEVESLIKAELSYNEKVLSEQKERIAELVDKNKRLESELTNFKAKSETIEKAIINAERSAEKTMERSNKEYELALLKLKSFSKRWDAYFKQLQEKYPLYPYVKESVELGEKLKKLIGVYSPKETIEQLDSELSEVEGQSVPFNPKQIINQYVAATSDNGFNLQEVLNPGELELEDICKELGLLDEE